MAKKKDGRTGEGHERLKVGSIDSLNCYYAHGESNPSFQRRSYWMLNTAYEHIVLVHYREVFEGKCISGSNVSLPSSSFSQNIVSVNCQSADLNDENSEICMPNEFSRRRRYNVVDSELLADNDDLGHLELDNESGSSIISSEPNVNAEIRKLKLYLLDDEEDDHIPLQHASDCNVQRSEPTTPWKDILHSYTDESVYKNGRVSEALTFGDHEFPTASEHIFEEMFSINDTNYPQNDAQLFSMTNGSKQPGRSNNYGEYESSNFLHLESNPEQPFPEEFEHFCLGTTTVMPSNGDDKRAVSLKDSAPYSSDFSTRQSYQNSKDSCFREKPTLSNKLIFHIREVCPEWAFSTDHTKSDFLSAPSEYPCAAMFDGIEVPLEIIQHGVLRCYAPKHAPGRITLCITTGNRESCSEVKYFEYRAKPEITSSNNAPGLSQSDGTKSREELSLLQKFIRTLVSDSLQKKSIPYSELDLLDKLKEKNGSKNQIDMLDCLLQELLKDKLQNWTFSKYQKSEVASCSLSKQEQCMIHQVSGLGYVWALGPLLDSGVGINFRDVNGWTALHWAAKFGREKMVASLVAAGASPGAVTDPTSHDPLGQTPASIAESCGYKGLSGYLSEVALTTHLSSLTIGKCENDVEYYAVEAEKYVDRVRKNSADISAYGTEDQHSLEESLAAVRTSALAAACIQAAFRAHSFRKKQKDDESLGEHNLTANEISSLSDSMNYIRGQNTQQKLHAALSIQKKFRGWKGRKNFLAVRRNVVKIQAHIRGYQVRKKYKEILWTVGVVEKVVLRWRRKRIGLRGFNPAESDDLEDVQDDVLKAFRKIKVDATLKRSVSRVLAMAVSPRGRLQYRHTRVSYHEAKAEVQNAAGSRSICSGQLENEDQDTFMIELDNWLNE